jgi:hypothetical protein
MIYHNIILWLTIPGESHSQAYRSGLTYLEQAYPAYAVSVVESGTPEAYTTSNLRASRATWGSYDSATDWIYEYGEEDWFTSALAISRTKAGLTYCNTNGPVLTAIGLGWCWDQGINNSDYLSATQEYIDYCTANNISTKVFFTTGPVDDGYTAEEGYYKSLDYEATRNYVEANPNRILFDYADILSYDDDGTPSTRTWDGKVYPYITATNLGSGNVGHIGTAGAIRLAKAEWWMLARMAGWDGVSA